jgi:PPP family 3-phenylpropionic acid transporter
MWAFIAFYAVCTVWGPYQTILLKDLGYSHTVIGILLGVNSLAGVAGPFLFGHFADKFGRYKPPLVVCHLIPLAMLAPLAWSPHPLATGLLLAVMSTGFSSILPQMEAITTIAIGTTGNYGKIRTPGTVSFILGALLLQFTPVLRPDNRVAILIWTGVFMVFSLGVTVRIPASYTDVSRSLPGGNGPAASGSKSLFTPLFVLGLITIAFSRLAMSGATSFLSLCAVEGLRWDAIGLLNAISATAEIPFLLFSKVFITRFGAIRCLIAGNLGMLARLLLLAIFPSPGGVVAAQCMHSLSYGLFHPAAIAFISSCVPPDKRALGMSLYLAIGGTLPGLLGNVLGGIILDHGGFRPLYASFSLFAVISLIFSLVIILNRRQTISARDIERV